MKEALVKRSLLHGFLDLGSQFRDLVISFEISARQVTSGDVRSNMRSAIDSRDLGEELKIHVF